MVMRYTVSKRKIQRRNYIAHKLNLWIKIISVITFPSSKSNSLKKTQSSIKGETAAMRIIRVINYNYTFLS